MKVEECIWKILLKNTIDKYSWETLWEIQQTAAAETDFPQSQSPSVPQSNESWGMQMKNTFEKCSWKYSWKNTTNSSSYSRLSAMAKPIRPNQSIECLQVQSCINIRAWGIAKYVFAETHLINWWFFDLTLWAELAGTVRAQAEQDFSPFAWAGGQHCGYGEASVARLRG